MKRLLVLMFVFALSGAAFAQQPGPGAGMPRPPKDGAPPAGARPPRDGAPPPAGPRGGNRGGAPPAGAPGDHAGGPPAGGHFTPGGKAGPK